MIKGITVTLYEKKETGTDPFGHPVYEEMPVDVENVLVAPSTTTEVLDVLNITGKKAVYDIAIPKGDDHTWKDCRVDFFGESWRVFGLPKQGIDENVPGRWNQRWMNVDDPVLILLDHLRRDYHKVTCQHDQIRFICIHSL